ncbi:hypothetical protein BCh11DRAFT_07813, partial [Burkholderia sp. Ch1-1]
MRAWYEGIPARAAVDRYLAHARVRTQSSRGVLGRIRRRLASIAEAHGRSDLALVFEDHSTERTRRASAVHRAIEALRAVVGREPQINDDISLWLPTRAIAALKAQ